MTTEKFIVATKQWSLGFIKETVYQGNVITVDYAKGQISIDGRVFPDTRDIDIAKRQAERFPGNPLIVPFSEEMFARLKGSRTATAPTPKPKPGENMKVIQSDEDLHEEIDISGTQISKRKREAEEAAKSKVKKDGMPVIRGDESPEERVERIRAEKLAGEKMPVVRDDSLGVDGGSKASALNAGQKLPTRAEVEAREANVRQQAADRKADAEAKRVQVIADTTSNKELQALVEVADASFPTPTLIDAPMDTPVEKSKPSSVDLRMNALESKVNSIASSVDSLVAALTRPPEPIVRTPVHRGPGRPRKVRPEGVQT